MAIFAGGLIGLLVRDSATATLVASLLTGWAPPLAGVFTEVVDGQASASPSLRAIGFLAMVWGVSRLFASLEVCIEAIFAGVPRRGVISRTVRRFTSLFIVAGIVVGAIVLAPAA